VKEEAGIVVTVVGLSLERWLNLENTTSRYFGDIMVEAPSPYDDYAQWRKWAYERRYGRGSWNGKIGEGRKVPVGLVPYEPDIQRYWDEEKALGVIESNGKFIGIACLVAKEVVDKEGYVRRFGLSFEKDIQWRAISGLLDHLARSPFFKAVLVTTSNIPFKLEPDISGELGGRIDWAKRNYNFHKAKADSLKLQLEQQTSACLGHGVYPAPRYLPKQHKEEEDYCRKFLETMKVLESKIQEHLKNYFLIKENLFATALFFYIYTNPTESIHDAIREIESRKYSARMEMLKTYFVECSDVKDPIVVFNTEFFPFFRNSERYFCIALAQDCAGFTSDKDVAVALKHMFITALELPTEEPIEEQIHIPTEEVSIQKPKSALLGYVVTSIIKKKVTKRRVYFPLDVLTGHGIIYGKTRTGKSFLSLILIQEALANGVRVKVFDPHGTLANRLKPHELLEVIFTKGRANITEDLQRIYDEASNWSETNELKQLIVLDETRLLKAKNLVYCLNELGKRGVGFLLITQYSTSIQAESRNVGTYFIMAAMSETEIERFKEVTLHPGARLITRLPRATSFIFSPYWYPEPFFVKHRRLAGE